MKKEKLPARRVRVLVAILVLWGVGIAARLCLVQVVQSSYYIDKAAQHQRYEVGITPPRGDILDRDGDVLASSIESYSVSARPSEMKDPRAVARKLARLTGLPVNDLFRKLDPSKRFVWVTRKISEREWKAIEKARLPEVGFEVEYRRFYPYGEMAAHLLGFVNVDELGRGGLEAKYDSVVRGEPGKVVGFRDALGNAYEHEQQVPQPGATLTTTLDKNTQYIVEKEIRVAADQTHAAGISVVVMDPNSGAVLAMASSPTFNPNSYNRFPQSSWSTNPSVSQIYEPGSTFKMVTIAAALEEGLTTPEEQIFCENGVLVLGRRKIHDHHPYGWLSVREIMQNSSNIGTIKLGILLGPERLKSYIDRFGFGQKTSVDLPAEVPGKVYELSEWEKTSIASVSMGHELSVTPLQTAVMVSTVANGGIRYKPYVVQRIDDPRTGVTEIKPSGTRVMAQTTAQQLRLMLEDVVTDGTAKTSRLAGYRAAGKTGTAEKANTVTGGYYGSKFVSSFAGFVPVSNPRLAIVVVVDDPKGKYYGGEVAAPVFKRIAEQVLRMKSVAPDVPDYVPPRYPVKPEKKKEKPTSPVDTKKRDFQVLDASMTSRTGQSGFQSGTIIVPDFTGQSMRQAMVESDKLGLEYRFSGSGLVVIQQPPPGTPVRPGKVLQFTLSLN